MFGFFEDGFRVNRRIYYLEREFSGFSRPVSELIDEFIIWNANFPSFGDWFPS
jgi:hypothetical protein